MIDQVRIDKLLKLVGIAQFELLEKHDELELAHTEILRLHEVKDGQKKTIDRLIDDNELLNKDIESLRSSIGKLATIMSESNG